MTQKIKNAVRRSPHLFLFAHSAYSIIRRFIDKLNGRNNSDIFGDIYAHNTWGDNESASGPGSNLAATVAIRQALPELCEKLAIRHILDIPCGDFYWMKEISLDNIQYTGADIVPELVDLNNQCHKSPHRQFVKLDLTTDCLPSADLVIVRDCFVHLPYAQIFAGLNNIRRSDAKFLLTTHFPHSPANHDIAIGQWRPVNLCAAPFHLTTPTHSLSDGASEAGSKKELALWHINDLNNIPQP